MNIEELYMVRNESLDGSFDREVDKISVSLLCLLSIAHPTNRYVSVTPTESVGKHAFLNYYSYWAIALEPLPVFCRVIYRLSTCN